MITLLGPTASGKTALSLEIAERLNLPVINVDSRQLYREMTVGTAKPTAEQRARVPHHLLDLRNPDQPITLQEFQAEAEPCIQRELQSRGMALLVGGSGLYLKALTSGLKPPAVPPQAQLRQQLSQLGQAICHPLLQQADPTAGAKIAPADAVRTQRALEVLYATGRPMSSQATATPPPWRVLELGLDPANLRQRIQQRTDQLEATRRATPAVPESAVPPARPTLNVGSLAVAAAGGVDGDDRESSVKYDGSDKCVVTGDRGGFYVTPSGFGPTQQGASARPHGGRAARARPALRRR